MHNQFIMDISFQSIKDILINNGLIKGHLNMTAADIQKLYRLQRKCNQKIQINLSKVNNILKSNKEKIQNLRSELKYCEDTLQKAFHPSKDKIALLYKNVGNKCYIKARLYWRGQQREVQVGSIPIVLNIIQKMIDKGHLKAIKLPESGTMTWELYKNQEKLIDATKVIAALKFQEYIIRKLSIEVKHQLENRNNENDRKTPKSVKYAEGLPKKEKYDWYLEWRRNNL